MNERERKTTPALSARERDRRDGDGRAGQPQKAIVIHPEPVRRESGSRPSAAALAEAVGLATAINLDVVLERVVRLTRPRPSTLIGTGVIEELAAFAKEEGVALLVVDAALTPVQQRNLEKALSIKVIDRTGLILEIFGERARTKEGVLQVELAALSYQRTRLVRSWTHLERQRGGAGFLGGPGERQLELDRRLIDDRIVRLKAELEEVKRTRGLHRAARKRVPYPVVALVGYTNAGKSTLFNRLTRADVLARDQLFATLDPTMRAIVLPSRRRIIMSDTVGFIADLPTQLVAAFRATLEEVTSADLILHVRDVADPDTAAQKRDVERVLTELESDEPRHDGRGAPMIEVLNKIDLLDAHARALIGRSDGIPVSALTGEGCDELLAVIDRHFAAERQIVELSVALENGAALAWLYRHGEVVAREDTDGVARVSVSMDDADRARFSRQFAAAVR